MEKHISHEQTVLRKAYVYDRLEGIRVLSEEVYDIDDTTLLRVPLPENRGEWYVRSKDPKAIEDVKRQLQAKGVGNIDEVMILEKVIPVNVNVLKRTGQYKERKFDRTLRLDRI